MSDDQGWGDFGRNCNELIETPVLNFLAEESITFNNFFISPLCAPTRASLLTGRYHLRTGVASVTGRLEIQIVLLGHLNIRENGTTFMIRKVVEKAELIWIQKNYLSKQCTAT